ncbi:hypothetical protein V8F06_005266 [Rhypophila decipiens]
MSFTTAPQPDVQIPYTRCWYTHPRYSSTAAAFNAGPEAVQSIVKRMLDRHREAVIKRSQVLDANQLQKLCITLDQQYDSTDLGIVVPPGYHLVYFTPSEFESELGCDGTDQPFAPGPPFTRRMWAGGRVQWYPENPLCVGARVTETTKLLDAVPKSGRGGNTMLIATVEKVFSTAQGPAVREERTWVFLEPPAKPSAAHQPKESIRERTWSHSSVSHESGGSPFDRRLLRKSAQALFRFSALTFNAHMIHYNQDWCRDVEGLPDLVVHGPLNLIEMMNYWRDIHGQSGNLQPLEVSYRAVSPLFVDEEAVMSTHSIQEVEDGSGSGELIYKIRLSKSESKSEGSQPSKLKTVVEGEIRAGRVGGLPVLAELSRLD